MSKTQKKDQEIDTKKAGELTTSANAPAFECAFLGYQPQVKPLGVAQGGGFRVSFNVSDTDWQNIQDLNNPKLQGLIFTVYLRGQLIK